MARGTYRALAGSFAFPVEKQRAGGGCAGGIAYSLRPDGAARYAGNPPPMRKQLLKRFRYSVRERGRADFESGCVLRVEVSHGHVRGAVEEEGEHAVELFFEEDLFHEEPKLISRCTCTPNDLDGPCHHQWALIEHCQREGVLDRMAEEFVPSALWRSRIEQLERAARRREVDPWTEVGDVGGRIRYLFDASLSHRSDFAYLTCEWQKKNRQGGWNQPKRLSREAPGREALGDELDRSIAELLAPFDVPESAEFSNARRLGRSRLPAAAAPRVLELVCRTDRLFATDGNRISSRALSWDPRPWRILPRIDRQGTRLVFDYELRRGEEQLELTSDMFPVAGGLLFTGDALRLLEDSPPWTAVESIVLSGPIEVPAKEEARLMQVTAALAGESGGAGDGLLGEAATQPTPVLEVTTADEAEGGHSCRIQFDYEGQVVAAEDRLAVVTAPDGKLSARARAFERRSLSRFLELGGELVQAHESAAPRPVLPPRELEPLVRGLVAEGWRLELGGARVRSGGRTRFQVSSGIDWFDVTGSMRFEGESVALPSILAAARRGQPFVELADGSLGLLPEDGSSQWNLVERLGQADGSSVRFSQQQAWLLDALLSSREAELQADAGFEALRERVAAVARAEPVHEAEDFQGELRAYQREGLGWIVALRELGLGGCLADDMGLGKTVQVLAALESRRRDRTTHKPSIVVAPKSLVFNWAREVERFTPELRVAVYTGPERAALLGELAETDVVLTTYGTLRRDIESLSEVEFDYAVLDEAQAVKNSSSLVSKAVRLLRAENRLALSGTPIENHLGELWAIFQFLNPGMLGRSSSFRRLFVGRRADRLDAEERERVARALGPFILRRTKEQVLKDLPEKSEQTLYCDLTEAQRRDYDEIRDFFRASLLGQGAPISGTQRMHVLEGLMRLRQACCHPSLLDPERIDEPSAKFEVLLPMLEELREEGHKALIFSQFTKHLAALQHVLDRDGFEYTYLDGRTRKREERVDRFQDDPSCTLFLISLKAGGFGLNLTAADYVFLLDPWWNPAAEDQAINRSHRIGQTRPVMAYRLISRDTAEEKVLELQAKKRELAEAILGREESALRDLSREDLELLLS